MWPTWHRRRRRSRHDSAESTAGAVRGCRLQLAQKLSPDSSGSIATSSAASRHRSAGLRRRPSSSKMRTSVRVRPLDRPPLPIVDLQFQMSPRPVGVVIGLRGNQVSDIARCGLSRRANLLPSWANCVGHPSGWSDPLSGLMQPQEAASPCGPRTANVRSSA